MAVLFALKTLILNRFFGQITPEVRGYADVYLTITAFSIPVIAIYEAGAAIFCTMGNAVLIYGAGMATDGAAISTLLSRFATAIVILRLLLNQERELENGMFQLGKILVLSLISSFGTQAIAANAITTNISAIQVIPGSAISLGITTVISRCVGKGDYEQVKYYNRLLILVTYAALFIIDFAIYFALPFILPVYHLSEKMALLATRMLLIHTLGAVLIWPLTFCLPASMRAAGDVRFAMVISIISMWVFRIGAAYLLAEGLKIGAIGVWLAMAVDWLFRAVVFGFRWLGGKWKLKKVI